jgi:hypothetical protein
LNGLDYTDEEIAKDNKMTFIVQFREVCLLGLYNDIKARLNKAVFDGFGGTYSDFDTSLSGLIMAGFERIYCFRRQDIEVNDMQ